MTGHTGLVVFIQMGRGSFIIYLLLLLGLTRLPAADRGFIRVETGLLMSAIISDMFACVGVAPLLL